MSGETARGWKGRVQAEIVLHLLSTIRRQKLGTLADCNEYVAFFSSLRIEQIGKGQGS
jgi:hypothetical protein